MIKNERQYRITKSQIAEFESALNEVAARSDMDPRLHELEQQALRSQLEELREEVHQYERLKSGRQDTIHLDSFDQLPRALIESRIAASLSQKELAERLGLKEQQIQRYEATEYASASVTRIQEVIEALRVNVAGELTCSAVGESSDSD